MPTVVRPKSMILFVHGFGSNASCWNPLLGLLRADSAVTAAYEFATWAYPTKWVELNWLGRIPRLDELGQGLGDEIDSPQYRGRDLVLVGHSQGGLVIQKFLAQTLQKREAFRLRNIRLAIFLATPTEGSTTGSNLRRLFSKFFTNSQEHTLRVLNPEIAAMKAIIRSEVVEAKRDSEGTRRIPVHAFCGMQDNVVPEASARGMFDNLHSVPGTHFTIIKPPTVQDPRYREFVEILLDPGGHKHRFEVQDYRAEICVEPKPLQRLPTPIPHRPFVEFDNYATVKRTVRFAPGNRCREDFTIRYGTRADGYVVGHTSHPNAASMTGSGRSEDKGDYFEFVFAPDLDDDYCMNVEVYQGYGEGHRNVHFHLGQQSHYRRMSFALDLSAYIRAGFGLTGGPHLYFEPLDRGHSDLCKEHKARDPIDLYSETEEGAFTWVLEHIEDGVVDIFWEFLPISTTEQDSATAAAVQP